MFTPDDIISIYTDADALDDGTLIDLTNTGLKTLQNQPINRITSAAFAELNDIAAQHQKGPVEYLTDWLPLALIIARHDQDWLILANGKLWLIPNEVDGYTLMLPSDY